VQTGLGEAEKTKKYEIGDRIFIQKPLVLGQLAQFIKLMAQVSFPKDIDMEGAVYILTSKGILSRAVAIVLNEEGKSMKDKDLDSLSAFFDENLDLLTTLGVVENFFGMTRPDLVLAKLEKMPEMMEKMIRIGSKKSSASSPGEISQDQNPSPGDSPSGSANPS